jgi:menaquinone-dependent protoporphyrinogen oxidase
MNILVVYATHHGATAEIAQRIGSNLQADVLPVIDVTSLDDYDVVIIGSAVEYGTWLPEALDFVKANQLALSQRAVYLFSVHIQNTDAASRAKREAYLDAVRELITPVDVAFFAGRTTRATNESMMPKWLARFMPTVNLIDWKKIDAWTVTIPAMT